MVNFQKIVASFTHIFVQDKASQVLLEQIGISHVTVGGDTRFDRVLSNARQGQTWDLLTDFYKIQPLLSWVLPGKRTWIACCL